MAPKVKLTDPTDDDESIKTYTQDQVNELIEKTADLVCLLFVVSVPSPV